MHNWESIISECMSSHNFWFSVKIYMYPYWYIHVCVKILLLYVNSRMLYFHTDMRSHLKKKYKQKIYTYKKIHTCFQFISLSVPCIAYARTKKTKQKLLHTYLHALSNVLVIMKGCTGMQRDMKWRHWEHHGWLMSLNGPFTASTITQQPWNTPSWCAPSLMNTWLNSNWL